MIEEITLKHLLPKVFEGMENSSRIMHSQIWEEDSFSFKKNCRICVVAESGGGKSSLLSFIYGIRQDYIGNIFFNKGNIRNLNIKEWCDIRINHIALLPQDMQLFPQLTSFQNIQLKNNLTNYKTEKEIEILMHKLGILEKKNDLVGKMSVGQQQRVAFIRTLCQPFDFIFLDEPVSHLDEENNKIMATIVEEEADSKNAGIISTSVGNHLMLSNPEYIRL